MSFPNELSIINMLVTYHEHVYNLFHSNFRHEPSDFVPRRCGSATWTETEQFRTIIRKRGKGNKALAHRLLELGNVFCSGYKIDTERHKSATKVALNEPQRLGS